MSYMCIMGLFACESSVECALDSSDVACYLNFNILEPCVFLSHISHFPLNQIAGFLFDIFGAMCYFSSPFTSPPHFFLSHYGSPSFLQAGCSSGTQIRSTLPFGWPFFFTTQALMHLRPLLTWYPMWTTLRQPTVLL